MSTRTVRYCDVCGQDYSERPDWMILSAPNAPEDVEAEWDFCSYQCLVGWISTDEVDDEPDDAPVTKSYVEQQDRRGQFHVEQPDGTPPPPAEVRRVHESEPTRELSMTEAQAKLDAAMAELRQKDDERPPMTLMEAIASGKLPFDRGPQ